MEDSLLKIVGNPALDLNSTDDDFIYHFGYTKNGSNLKAIFGDVKYVCCGGSASRMQILAANLEKELTSINSVAPNSSSKNISNSERHVVYKVGPVLCINHGMGGPAISIMINETLKFLYYAGCKDVTFIRVGTSGGIGVEPGTIVVTDGALNGLVEPYYIQYILGKEVKQPTSLDMSLVNDLLEVKSSFKFPVTTGHTMQADDFYEEQGRRDGALCEFSEEGRVQFLRKLHDVGVRNIEMEACSFSSICNRAGVKGAIVCVAIVNRLNGDQIDTPKKTLIEWEERPLLLVTEFIKKKLLQL